MKCVQYLDDKNNATHGCDKCLHDIIYCNLLIKNLFEDEKGNAFLKLCFPLKFMKEAYQTLETRFY